MLAAAVGAGPRKVPIGVEVALVVLVPVATEDFGMPPLRLAERELDRPELQILAAAVEAVLEHKTTHREATAATAAPASSSSVTE
jgi:hypothetical protein